MQPNADECGSIADDIQCRNNPDLLRFLQNKEDHHGEEQLDQHRTNGDSRHLLQSPVKIIRNQRVYCRSNKEQQIENKIVMPAMDQLTQDHKDPEGNGRQYQLGNRNCREDASQIILVLSVSGNVFRCGQNETEINDKLEIYHD